MSFSVPIFPSGISAVLRADAPPALGDVLSRRAPSGPLWRGSPAQVLTKTTFLAVKGTTGETWLDREAGRFQAGGEQVDPAESYDAGVAKVVDGEADVLFGDRPILMEAVARSPSASSLKALDELFTYELLALTLPRNDDDFRLAVDKGLSKTFRSSGSRDALHEVVWGPHAGCLGLPPAERAARLTFERVADAALYARIWFDKGYRREH